MVKPKSSIKIEYIYPGLSYFDVWCDNPTNHIREILMIEGIIDVSHNNKTSLSIFTDPRYDIHELMREVEELLLAETPSMFTNL